MNVPLVSVLMTAYNREQYIAEAIESVLESSYKNFELIIVDDFSVDRTVEIARKYETLDKRVKVYINEKNLGDYTNRNKAASFSKGKYLVYVDSDDKIFQNGLELCINSMTQFPNVKFGTYYRLPAKEIFVENSENAIRNHFFNEPYLMIGPGGTIIERIYFLRIGGFPEKYGPANDMYYNLKAASSSPILMIPFEFFFYRRHSGQEIQNPFSYLYNNYRYNRDAVNELNLYLTNKEKEWLQLKNKRRFSINLIKFFIKTGNIKKTMEAYRLAEFSVTHFFHGIFH